MTGFDIRSPGLYLEAADTSGPPTVLSAVTAFVGIARRGPLHRPQAVASWGEFLDVFGEFVPYGHLAESVYGFFLNGGERCVVVRVADTDDYSDENPTDACPRVGLLKAATNATPVVDYLGDMTVALTAIDEGSWGNEIRYRFEAGSRPFMLLTNLADNVAASSDVIQVAQPFDIEPGLELRLRHPDNPVSSRTVQVADVDWSTGHVTLQDPLGADLPAGSQVLGRGFKLLVSYGDKIEIFDNLSMSSENPRYFLQIVNGPPHLADYIDRRRQGHSILVRATHVFDPDGHFRPSETASSNPSLPSGFNALSGGGDGVRFAQATLDGVGGVTVGTVVVNSEAGNAANHGRAGNLLRVEVTPFQTEVALPIRSVAGGLPDVITVQDATGFVGSELVTVTDPDDPALTETVQIDRLDAGNVLGISASTPLTEEYGVGAVVSVADRVTLSIFREGEMGPLETHYNLSGDPTDPRSIAAVLNTDSTILCAEPPADAAVPQPGSTRLSGGADPGDIEASYYVGYLTSNDYFQGRDGAVGSRFGVATLESINEVNLVTVPDLARSKAQPGQGVDDDPLAELVTAQRLVLLHCAKMGERLALLDPLPGQETDSVLGQAAALAGDDFAKFGAFYYPWLDLIYREDKHRIPPSGPVAGLIARSDRAGGLNQAPANLPFVGIVDLEQRIDQDAQADLNPSGINCVRKMRDGTVLLWGGRTLSPVSQARYVNVRRVLLGVNKFLSQSLLWAVFEPTGPALWRRIEAALIGFLQSMLAAGMTAGNRPEDSFYAKCDEETNPTEVRDAGQVVAEIGLALMAPAEFIILTVRRTADAVNVVEEDV